MSKRKCQRCGSQNLGISADLGDCYYICEKCGEIYKTAYWLKEWRKNEQKIAKT